MRTIHEGDVGTRLLFRFKEEIDGVAQPLSIAAATVRKVKLKRPGAAVVEKPLAVVGDGSAGEAEYFLVDGDVPVGSAGAWVAQGYVEFGTGKWSADTVNFTVRKKLV